MNILYVASEVVPFAKTGGLADVAAALPKAIHQFGHDIRILMPHYGCIKDPSDNLAGVPVYFFEDESFAKRDELYVKDGRDYPDNHEAFQAFCQSVIPMLKDLDWRPDIIHCNDWQTGLITQLIKEARVKDQFFARTAIVYSVHNMAYQGQFDDVNFARVGFEQADLINTVSKEYAQEIQTQEYGCGLEELLQKRSQDIYGVVNGVDYSLWNPATDKNIAKRFSPATMTLRPENKAALQAAMSLPVSDKIPIIGMISRLDSQKGFDILATALSEIMALGCQLVILGKGDPNYHSLLKDLQKDYPNQLGLKLGFDDVLAHQIYAGSDFFLMPSKYEPCGLGQLVSFKYGAIPIVRKTGGLADTVSADSGFVFEQYTKEALAQAVKQAIVLYHDRSKYKKMQQAVMGLDYSWANSAKKYIGLYLKALAKIGIAPL